MNRRGFFSSLFESEPGRFFFGIQIVSATLTNDDTALRLRQYIAEALHDRKPQEKKAFYKEIITLLIEQQPYWEYGFWDYVPHDDDAITEFESWTNDIESSMATEPGEIGGSIDEMHRLSNDKWYIVTTVLFVFETADVLSPIMDSIESIPEDDYHTRTTYKTLLELIYSFNFEFCEADAVFIMPGTDEDGFSWEDLHQAGWEYLQPLTW